MTQLFIWAEDSQSSLLQEVAATFPGAQPSIVPPGLLLAQFPITPGTLPHLAFSRQWLPDAQHLNAASVRHWAELVCEAIIGRVPDDQPWGLHVEPHYAVRSTHHIGARAWHSALREQHQRRWPGDSASQPPGAASAGQQRCALIRAAITEQLKRCRRHLLRQLRTEPQPFTAQDSLVQLLLTAPDEGYLSVAVAPLPSQQRHLLWPFPKGAIPPATDKSAPSRAFAKLVEAEIRMGTRIQARETCVDLGAAPGSWTYVAVQRGARVIAVDRAPLREDLQRQISFVQGDAFAYKPAKPVDWLLCDVIAPADSTAGLLGQWLTRQWCRHFVVTLKWRDETPPALLTSLKRDLLPLATQLFITRLNANKKEICVFGELAVKP